ncbi:MAG: nucleotidyltransferase domain-containing protein [Candidatus Micrarchaeia archaeon]
MLNLILRSKAEVKVLSVILFQDGLHLREIARQANISPFEARREILILQKAGLLNLTKRGNQTLATINKNCPYLSEIKSLYLKTDGIFAMLKNNLIKILQIRYAIIYGSMARGEENEKSDLDLLIIGTPDEKELAKSISKLQWKTTREINYNLWSEDELAEKVGSSFLSQIVKEKKVFLIGEESKFSRLAKKTSNKTN